MKNSIEFYGLQQEYLKTASKGFKDRSVWIVRTLGDYTYICNSHAIARVDKANCLIKDTDWQGNPEFLVRSLQFKGNEVLLRTTGIERIHHDHTLVEFESTDGNTFKVYLNKKFLEMFGFSVKWCEVLFYGSSPKSPVFLSLGIPEQEEHIKAMILPVFINEKQEETE